MQDQTTVSAVELPLDARFVVAILATWDGIAPVADNPRVAILRFADETYLVDIAWAMGNARRLPDKTSPMQMAEALALSHPEVLGVGAKYPPRNE